MCTMPIVLYYIIHMYAFITCMYLWHEVWGRVSDQVFYHATNPPHAHGV